MPHPRGACTPIRGTALERFKQNTEANAQDFERIDEICKCLVLSQEDLRRVMEVMKTSMEKGLDGRPEVKSSLKMIPSFVRAIPNGTEHGNFLALDFGGTNFRVLRIKLDGGKSDMWSKIYRFPEHLMTGDGTKLFDHIAACLADFMEEHDLKNVRRLPLGFTFSFAVQQEGLTHGKLIRWSKGFKASGVEGTDVVYQLRDAIRRRGDIDVDVVALLNDTVGTLLACAFKDSACQMGVILGTGTNACYMEKIANCPKLKKYNLERDPYPKDMIINMEWGAFGDDGCLSFARTIYDEDVDKNSINPGYHLFEKMISGMYMGELVRLVLTHLAKERLIFGGDVKAISKRNVFSTKYVSDVESEQDEAVPYTKTQQILKEIGVRHVTATDCIVVAYVCTLISTRAACLCAAGIAAVLMRMQKKYVTVGIDGSVYRFHPNFARLLDHQVDLLLPKHLLYQLMLSEDGSGRGAAIVAAVASRMEHEGRICNWQTMCNIL